jgi:hypothetical protein
MEESTMPDDEAVSDGAPQEQSNSAYEEVTDPAFTAFADSCQVVQGKDGASLLGVCPRCQHEMMYPYPRRAVSRRIRLLGKSNGPAVDRVLRMLCTCEQDHPGRPEAGRGCGAYWKVTLQESAS